MGAKHLFYGTYDGLSQSLTKRMYVLNKIGGGGACKRRLFHSYPTNDHGDLERSLGQAVLQQYSKAEQISSCPYFSKF